ncbi:MAG TPA: ankyrin repeat domain-containing protein [Pirellulales bacterium]|jgi:ankyrin repeat protein
MSRSHKKSTLRFFTSGLWLVVLASSASCTQSPAPVPAENAVAKSEADVQPIHLIPAEGEEENVPTGFEALTSYIEEGKSDSIITVLNADPTWINFRDHDDFTLLHYATQYGKVEVVEWLLNHGADVNAVGINHLAPLHLVENPEIAALLLHKKPDLTVQSNGKTPLQYAVDNLVRPDGIHHKDIWYEIIRLMLDAGAEYDIITAIDLDDLDRVTAILKESPELASRLRFDSPLRTAAALGRLEICQYLIREHHVDVNDLEGGYGFPVIQMALAYPNVVKLLIESGANVKARITGQGGPSGVMFVGDDATLLHYAACVGVPETIDMLIDNGIDVFAHSRPGYQKFDYPTALEVASLFGKADNARAILKHPRFAEADVKLRQELVDKCLLIAGRSPQYVHAYLFQGGRYQWPELVELLLENGADPSGSEGGRNVVLIVAEEIHPTYLKQNREAKDIIANLIRHGATLDIVSAVAIGDEAQVSRLLNENPEAASSRHPNGYPVLHFAVDMNYQRIVAALLKAGCDVDIRNECDGTGYLGQTALHSAAFWGHYDIAKVLIESGADVNALTDRRNTPLHEAAQCGSTRVLRLLLENGAIPDAVGKDGETPLDWCRQMNRTNAAEIEEILRAHIVVKAK